MTYNIGNGLASGKRLAKLLRESDAYIVALQELSVCQEAVLKTALLDEYLYRCLNGAGTDGMGFLSKYPIEAAEIFFIDSENPFQAMVLNVNGKLLRVINGHPPPQLIRSRTQCYGWGSTDIPTLVKDYLPDADTPYLLPGDFNVTDQSNDYQLIISKGLRDDFHEGGKGFGFTFPCRPGSTLIFPPVYRIDYIFQTAHFDTLEAYRGGNAGSDHLPVVAELLWKIAASAAEPNDPTPSISIRGYTIWKLLLLRTEPTHCG